MKQGGVSPSLPIYKCLKCGSTSDSKTRFYMSKYSPLFESNDFYTPICNKCAQELYNFFEYKLKDQKMAMICLCHCLDVYFSETLYQSIKENDNFSLGNYLKLLNGTQYKDKNFSTYLAEALNRYENSLPVEELLSDSEDNWTQADIKNKNYVLQTIGYDCFDDKGYTFDNKKFLFNTLADYLSDDVLEDNHKLQSVISLVKTTLQLENINRLINAEFRNKVPNNELIKSLTAIKTQYISNINSVANENGIAAKTSGKVSKGSNTLTNIMKEMAENGFEEIKVNVEDYKMSKAYQSVAQANAKALFDELNYQSDDYARLLADQSVMVGELQDDVARLQEELRLIRIEKKALVMQLNGDGE